MANGLGSFFVGASGLQSAQNALNVTANNLANVNTKGYVREQVIFSDRHYNTFKTPTLQTNMQQNGLGVSIGDVVHARDIFVDKAYRLETGRQNFYETCFNTSRQVEDIFQELDGEEFKQSIEDLRTAFEELSKAPGDGVNQNLVVQKAQLLVARTQALYSDLQSYQNNMNGQIKQSIERVNEIGKQIYELNLYVQKVETAGVETAMTARDQRDALIDELSGYFNVSATEDSSGFVWIQVEGADLLQEYGVNEIGLKADNGTGFYTPYWKHLSDTSKDEYTPVVKASAADNNGKPIEINSETNTDIGSVKALLFQRGSGYGTFRDMETSEAYALIEDVTMMESQAQIDLLFHTIATTLNDMLCPNKELDIAISYVDKEGNTVDVPAGAKILDVENCNVGSDGELPPHELFSRAAVDRYTKVTANDGNTYYIYNEEDQVASSTWYNVGNTLVNADVARQQSLLPVMKQNGAVDYKLGSQIVAAWDKECLTITPDDNSICNFEGFYNKMISNLGTSGNTYYSESETLSTTVTSLDNQRLQVTGVSSDDELTNMVKFQAAYNAASRYITVISQMTELIVTGLI